MQCYIKEFFDKWNVHCNADSNPLVTWNWAQPELNFTQSVGLFCIWHQIKHFLSLWPLRQADERKFLKAPRLDLCPAFSPLSVSPLSHSFGPVQFFNMPKSCVKISQRDRKQRYKLYELIKHRDPKRRKGQKRERERVEGGGVKNMAYDIDRCPMCESACHAVVLSLSSQAFFQLFRNRAYLWCKWGGKGEKGCKRGHPFGGF